MISFSWCSFRWLNDIRGHYLDWTPAHLWTHTQHQRVLFGFILKLNIMWFDVWISLHAACLCPFAPPFVCFFVVYCLFKIYCIHWLRTPHVTISQYFASDAKETFLVMDTLRVRSRCIWACHILISLDSMRLKFACLSFGWADDFWWPDPSEEKSCWDTWEFILMDWKNGWYCKI